MKYYQILVAGSEKLKSLCRRWKERPVRPRESGWIRDIRKGQYPTETVRETFKIGGEENRPITCFERVFMVIFLLRNYIDLLFAIKKVVKMCVKNVSKFEESENKFLEWYILIKFVVLFFLLWAPMSHWPVAATYFGAYFCWEAIGLLFYHLTVLFVDRYSYNKKPKPPYCYWFPHSFNRSILLALWSYIEMIIVFAYLYRHFGFVRYSHCGTPITTVGEALYFSIVTITTLGYGDMRPNPGWGRFFASIEPIMGIILLVLVVGLFFVELGKRKTSKNNN